MIEPESALRRLPTNLDPSLSLIFDGLRLTAEISTLAYSRLKTTLSQLTAASARELDSATATAALLDAWALVDAIDRCRAIWHIAPFQEQAQSGEMSSLVKALQPIRKVRNVTKHMAESPARFASQHGTALGSLSWFSIIGAPKGGFRVLTLVPGALAGQLVARATNPIGKVCELPTGHVEISAGGHTANLSEAYSIMAHWMGRLNEALAKDFDALDAPRSPTNQLFTMDILHFMDEEPPATTP